MPSTRGVRLLKEYIGSSDELARQRSRARVAALAPVVAAKQQRMNGPRRTPAPVHLDAHNITARNASDKHNNKRNTSKDSTSSKTSQKRQADATDTHTSDATTVSVNTEESQPNVHATVLPEHVMTQLQQLQTRGACRSLRKRQLLLIHCLGSDEDCAAPDASDEPAMTCARSHTDTAAGDCGKGVLHTRNRTNAAASNTAHTTIGAGNTAAKTADEFTPRAFRVKRVLLPHVSDMVDAIAVASLMRSACGERVGEPGCAVFVLTNDTTAAELLSRELRDRYALPVMYLGDDAPRFPSFPERAAGMRASKWLLMPHTLQTTQKDSSVLQTPAHTLRSAVVEAKPSCESAMRMSSAVPVVVATPAGFLAVDRRSALWKFVGVYVIALTESPAQPQQQQQQRSNGQSSLLQQLTASSPAHSFHPSKAAAAAAAIQQDAESKGHTKADEKQTKSTQSNTKHHMTSPHSDAHVKAAESITNRSLEVVTPCMAHALARQRWRCLSHCRTAAVLATHRAALVHAGLDWLLTLEPVDEPQRGDACVPSAQHDTHASAIAASNATDATLTTASSSSTSISSKAAAAAAVAVVAAEDDPRRSCSALQHSCNAKVAATHDGLSRKAAVVVYYAVADGVSRFQFLFGLVHSLPPHRGLLVHVATRPMAAFLYNVFYALSSSSSSGADVSATLYTVPSHVQLMTDYDGEGIGAPTLSLEQGRALCDEFDAIVSARRTSASPGITTTNSNSYNNSSSNDMCTNDNREFHASAMSDETHCNTAPHTNRPGVKRARTPPHDEGDIHAPLTRRGKTSAVLFSCQGLVPRRGSVFVQYDMMLDIPSFNAFVCDALTPGRRTFLPDAQNSSGASATTSTHRQAPLHNDESKNGGDAVLCEGTLQTASCSNSATTAKPSSSSSSSLQSLCQGQHTPQDVRVRRVTTTRSRRRSVSPPPASAAGSSSSSSSSSSTNVNMKDRHVGSLTQPHYRHVLLLLRSAEVSGALYALQSQALRASEVCYRPLPHPPSHTRHLWIGAKLRALHQKVFAIQNAAYAAYKATMTVYCTVGPRRVYDRSRLRLSEVAQEFGFADAPLLDLRLCDTPFRPREDVYKAARLKQKRERATYHRFAGEHIVGEMPEEHVAERGDDQVARRARKRW